MLTIVRRSAARVAALGLGGSAIAGAAGPGAASNAGATGNGAAPARPAHDALSSAVAAKVKAAAMEKVPGATVLRVEGGGPYATAYHAHIETSGGTQQVVLVDASFTATAVQADRHPGGPGAPTRPRRP